MKQHHLLFHHPKGHVHNDAVDQFLLGDGHDHFAKNAEEFSIEDYESHLKNHHRPTSGNLDVPNNQFDADDFFLSQAYDDLSPYDSSYSDTYYGNQGLVRKKRSAFVDTESKKGDVEIVVKIKTNAKPADLIERSKKQKRHWSLKKHARYGHISPRYFPEGKDLASENKDVDDDDDENDEDQNQDMTEQDQLEEQPFYQEYIPLNKFSKRTTIGDPLLKEMLSQRMNDEYEEYMPRTEKEPEIVELKLSRSDDNNSNKKGKSSYEQTSRDPMDNRIVTYNGMSGNYRMFKDLLKERPKPQVVMNKFGPSSQSLVSGNQGASGGRKGWEIPYMVIDIN